MSEGQRGRPKNHPAKDHHFTAQPETIEAVVENPTNLTDIVRNVGAIGVTEPELPEASTQTYQKIDMSESPIERKIQALVESQEEAQSLNGWFPLDNAPHGGLPVQLSELPAGDGILAFWKRTRAFNGKRWAETGRWVNHQTGMDIDFPAKYWKERF